MNTIVVALGRYGDIINVLPCVEHFSRQLNPEGDNRCPVMVSEPFADILDGCPYAKPVVFDGNFTETDLAVEYARNLGYEDIRVARITERDIGVTTQCEHFNQEQWRQIGCLPLWDTLKLTFPARNRKREQGLIDWHRPCPEGAPFGLYNFSGKSSPLAGGVSWVVRNMGMIRQSLGAKSLIWLDLGKVKAERLYDLLGLMDAASILVTGDTSTLHLAAASKVPTINFIQNQPTLWHGSLPRNNNVLSMRYDMVKDLEEPLKL